MSLTPASDVLRADHRRIEVWIDRLLEVAKRPIPTLIRDVRHIFGEIQSLTSPHFTKEESVFYPRLRPILPDLLAQMDEQHAYIREVEDNLRELIATVNVGLALMIVTNLFPGGVLQLMDVLNHGYWHARGPGFLDQGIVRLLEWFRLPGDLVFIAFGVVPLLFAAGLTYRSGADSRLASEYQS